MFPFFWLSYFAAGQDGQVHVVCAGRLQRKMFMIIRCRTQAFCSTHVVMCSKPNPDKAFLVFY